MPGFDPRHRETIRGLLAKWKQLPPEHKHDFQLCFEVIKWAFGREWIEKHFDPRQEKDGIFKISTGGTNEEVAKNYRIIDLAECLVNLRYVEGIHECIQRLKEAENPEPGYAELHIAKMLYANEWSFKIVTPRDRRGDDYDLEIICHNQTRCGDTKCKLESTVLSTKTIENTLRASRDQLPPDGPGVFFIKIPQEWMASPNWQRTVGQGAIDFFNHGTQRVASVVFYVEPLHYRDGWIAQGHEYLEIQNPRHKLQRQFDWTLFTKWKPPKFSPYGMPPFYIALANFPAGVMHYGPFDE